jgi:hypothetical protein
MFYLAFSTKVGIDEAENQDKGPILIFASMQVVQVYPVHHISAHPWTTSKDHQKFACHFAGTFALPLAWVHLTYWRPWLLPHSRDGAPAADRSPTRRRATTAT